MPSNTKQILLLESDAERGKELEGILRDLNYAVESASSYKDAVGRMKKGPLDLVLASTDGPGKGFDLCKAVRGDKGLKKTPVVLLSAAPDADLHFSKHQKGSGAADAYIKCPAPPEDIVDSIECLIGLPSPPNGSERPVAAAMEPSMASDDEVRALKRDNEELQEQLHFYQKQLEQVSMTGEKESREMDKLLGDLQDDLEKARKEKEQNRGEAQLIKADLAKKDRELRDKEKAVIEAREEAEQAKAQIQEELEELRATFEENEEKHRRAQNALREYYKPKLAKVTKLEKKLVVFEDELVKVSTEAKREREKVKSAEKEIETIKEQVEKEKKKSEKARDMLKQAKELFD